jgi:uncharacterized membrane protein YqiK
MAKMKNAAQVYSLIEKSLTKLDVMADSSSRRTIAEKNEKASWDLKFDQDRHSHEIALLEANPEYALKRMEQRYAAEMKRMEQKHALELEEMKGRVLIAEKERQANNEASAALVSITSSILAPVTKVVETACALVGEVDLDKVVNRAIDSWQADEAHRRAIETERMKTPVETARQMDPEEFMKSGTKPVSPKNEPDFKVNSAKTTKMVDYSAE